MLPAFLKKEGLLPLEGIPSYKLIEVCVLGEEQEVLTLLGLKPRSIESLGQEKIQDALRYVDASIKGAEEFDVEHSDMIEMKKLLKKLERQGGKKS